jgi:DDE family transposase
LGSALIEDHLVKAGRGKRAIDLRLVTFKTGGTTYEALTNVLDPERLSPEDAVKLYPLRWKIERLFYDLKVVLNLERFYAANPNAVAMQVYAAAMIHAAFRIAQADLARKLDIRAEELSTEKLFPFLAFVAMKVLEAEFIFETTRQANPEVELRKPSWKNLPGTVVPLDYLLVEHRSPLRKKKQYDPERRKWKSLRQIYENGQLT